MGWTLADFRAFIQGQARDSSATFMRQIDRFVNIAGRDVCRAAEWSDLRGEDFLVTTAPYSDGTVAIANGAKVITGTGTAFSAVPDTGSYRWALDYDSPFYDVSTRDTGLQLTLEELYTETTETAASYVLYQDRYKLPEVSHKIRGIYLLKQNYPKPVPLSENDIDEFFVLPSRAGVPEAYALDKPDSQGFRQIRIWPVPDDVYRLFIRYQKQWQQMASPADVCILGNDLCDLVAERALFYAFQARGKKSEAQLQLATYRSRLDQEINDASVVDEAMRMGQFNAFLAYEDPLTTFIYPAEEA